MKHRIFTLLCITALMYIHAFAQPVIIKQADAGSSGSDNLTCMALTRDKGVIAGGFSYGNASCQKTGNNRDTTGTTYDYWVVKYNTKGDIEWDKTLGGNNYDQLVTVLQTFDGGYILGGSSYSGKSGDKNQDSRGLDDYWVIKLNADGIVQWQRTLGGSLSEKLSSVEQTSDSGYIIRGTSQSGRSGDKTTDATGAWIVKLSKHGKIQWDKTVPALQQTRDGGYISISSPDLLT